MIRFWELARCAGVDEDETPFPGMAVPLGGSNVVVLDTQGKDLKVDPNQGGVEIEEFDAAELRKKLIETSKELSQPGVDSQYKDEMMPRPVLAYKEPRFFRIHGKKHAVKFPGALVQAKSGRKAEATLHVAVLDAVTVKIAIRNVTVPGEHGTAVYHATKPCDPEKECERMNAVWTPQTNMTFELVPSPPAFIDDRDKATKLTLGKGFGLKDPSSAVFPDIVDPPKMKETFQKLMVTDADLTFFVVDKLLGGPNGVTYPTGVAFIASNHGTTTFAHEAGHYLGGGIVNGAWDNLHDTQDKDKDKDIRMLMRGGGAGWKIPYKQAERFRGFFTRRSAH